MRIEEELKYALSSGDKGRINITFEKIYVDYFKLGLFIANQYLNENDSLEITEDVFVSFFLKITKEMECNISNIKQYLCSSIKNRAILELRKSQKTVPYNDEIHHDDVDTSFIPESLFKELSKEEQYIISEHILLEKTFKDISLDLNKSINTIKSIYRRACHKAKKKLTWFKN